jgi:hypothetical protein
MKSTTIILKGGLGNQLFQLAFACFFKKKFPHVETNLNVSWFKTQKKRKFNVGKYYSHNFSINYNEISTLDKIFSYRNEKISSYLIKNFFIYKKIFNGYWQETYYANYLDKKKFNKILFKKKRILPKNYYIMHFRAGDFKLSKSHCVLGYDYYQKCINKYQDLPIFALGDKMHAETIIKNINTKKKITFLDLNELDSMRTIINAKGGMASNSTFCWWGVYLNANKKKFVMPEKWMQNINYSSSKIKLKLVKSV